MAFRTVASGGLQMARGCWLRGFVPFSGWQPWPAGRQTGFLRPLIDGDKRVALYVQGVVGRSNRSFHKSPGAFVVPDRVILHGPRLYACIGMPLSIVISLFSTLYALTCLNFCAILPSQPTHGYLRQASVGTPTLQAIDAQIEAGALHVPRIFMASHLWHGKLWTKVIRWQLWLGCFLIFQIGWL